MKPKDLIKSIYLGDRGCKQFVHVPENKEIRIQVDCISFLRPGSTTWDYYSEHDLQDGWIVFSGAENVLIEPANVQPNDFINEILVENLDDSNGRDRVTISISSVNSEAKSTEVVISASVADAYIEDSLGKTVAPPH
jgi:hypothetical protein